MKRKIFVGIFIVLFGFGVVGCEKKEEITLNEEKEVVKEATWAIDTNSKAVKMSSKTLDIFNKATKKYDKMELDPVALLGINKKSSYKNYMFLCKGTKDKETTWKIVIIKNTNKNKSTVQKVKELDVTKYFAKDVKATKNVNYKINEKMLSNVLDNNLENALNIATKDSLIKYSPIALFGVKDSNNKEYSVLCLGKKDKKYSISVLTILDDKDNSKLLNTANITLDELVK